MATIKVEIHNTTAKGDFARTLFPRKVTFRGRSFVVPKGFEFDGASIPRLFRAAVASPLDPETARAGLAHDFIYRTQPQGWTRKDADLMFFCFLLEDGLPINRALKAYIAVRLFGWIAWKKNKQILEMWRGGRK